MIVHSQYIPLRYHFKSEVLTVIVATRRQVGSSIASVALNMPIRDTMLVSRWRILYVFDGSASGDFLKPEVICNE